MFKTLDECCVETNYQHLEVQDEGNKSYTYTSADKKFTWEWHTKKERGFSGRAANQNILRSAEGTRGRAKPAKRPVEGFELFITHEMMQDVVNNTNKNIRNFMTRFHDVLKKSSKYTYVKETDLIELKALIGLLYLRAALQLDIFKTREIFFPESSHEIFAATMSCNCFAFLICFLEFDDKETRRQRWKEDKFTTIREFFMRMNENNGRCRNPLPYVSADETLYPYRGRIGMKQYKPSKPEKYGLLYRSLCDAKVPYTNSTLPHAGKPEVIGANDYHVTGCDEYTKWLVNNFQIYGTLQGQNISLDRYFTSVTLAEWCLERNTTIVGTLKSDQKGIPKEMKGVADREEKSTAFATPRMKKQCSYCTLTRRRKGKNILAIATMHNQVKLSVDERKKPHALVFYDHTKGGVDVVDLISAKMLTRMTTRKWTLNGFAFMLDTASTNAKTIVKENTPTEPLSTFQFTWELGKSLIRCCIQQRHVNPVGLTHSLDKSICKVLGIQQPIERRQKPELLNKGQRCYLCVEEVNAQPDYKANKDKLNNKVKTVCISCKNTTCIKHFITTCDRCFDGSDE